MADTFERPTAMLSDLLDECDFPLYHQIGYRIHG